jgi:hypothetical protein
MAHNRQCAEARKPGCECACGGASHGCQGAFQIADGPLGGVLSYVEEREKDWDARPSDLTLGQAAIGCAQADVVYWLHRDHELLRCARAAQTEAFEDGRGAPAHGLVLRDVAAHLGPQRMEEFQTWARGVHFWCELLAQMAWALAQYEKVRTRIFRMTEDVLHQRFEADLPHRLHQAGAIASAANWAWRRVLPGIVGALHSGTLATLLAGGDAHRLLWPVRVVAVLMCPDASRHPAVRQHCWEPIVRLARAEVRGAVRERLGEAFPQDLWFPPNRGAP